MSFFNPLKSREQHLITVPKLRENITKVSHLLKEGNPNDEQLFKTMESIFNNLNPETYLQLDIEQKKLIISWFDKIPGHLFPQSFDQISSIFKQALCPTVPEPAPKKVKRSMSELEDIVSRWTCGTEDEKKAANRLINYFTQSPSGSKLDLSDLKLTYLPSCFFTDNEFADIHVDSQAIVNMGSLSINCIKYNQALYKKISSQLSKEKVFPSLIYKNLTEMSEISQEVATLSFEEANRYPNSFFAGQARFLKAQGAENLTVSLEQVIKDCHLEDNRKKACTILNKIITSIKEDRDPQFDSLLYKEEIQVLFCLIDYLGLQDLQIKYFEPFNKVFSHIPIEEIPIEIQSQILILNLDNSTLKSLDLSGFTHLKEFTVLVGQNDSVDLINNLPPETKAKITMLDLRFCKLKELNLSDFINLQELSFYMNYNFSVDLINNLPPEAKAKITKLNFDFCDVQGLNLSDFTNLQELSFCYSDNFSVDLINNLPPEAKAKITKLNLNFCELKNLNLFDFTNLQELTFLRSSQSRGQNFCAHFINNLSLKTKANITKLNFNFCELKNLNLSDFTNLQELIFSQSLNFSVDLINNLSPKVKAKLTRIDLENCDVQGLNLSDFTNLQELMFFRSRNFSVDLINNLSPKVKAKLTRLDLENCDVQGLNLSEFTQLKAYLF